MRKFTSGLYVVSASDGEVESGCVINTGLQLTSTPLQVMVAVNKENYTEGVIGRAGHFALTVLTEECDMPYIGRFGFQSGADVAKYDFEDTLRTELGDPYTAQFAAAVLACKVVQRLDVGTHVVYVGEVVDAEVLSDANPLTYAYYHSVLKGKTPPKASSFVAEEPAASEGEKTAGEKTYTFRCAICGYEVTVDTPELPEGFSCEVCGVGADLFKLVEE